ncbi:MAG: TerB family tellurite resistance protein [Victivallales bacterium]|nr:TerB family tellurite resistance protein [Victivallales bacterium]
MGKSKWIGGVLGAIWGGPIGALVGFGVGWFVDKAVDRQDDEDDISRLPPRTRHANGSSPYAGAARAAGDASQQVGADEFTICVCVLIAGVMKSDGVLHPEEISLVSQRLKANYHFDDAGVKRMLGFIQELAQGNWSVEEFALRARRHLRMPARRNLLYFLLEIAYANGQYVFAEQQVIRTIAACLGLRAAEVAAMEASLNRADSGWAYQVLELSADASDAEVKKAYRRLAMMHHPDKVAGQGEVAEAAATRKFQAINAAYEKIKQERNFN